MPQALPVIGAVANVVGTVGSLVMQARSARLQRESIEKQDKQQQLAVRRSRRQAYRQTQIARARALTSAEGAGSLFGSGASGGIGALSSQLGSELGFQTSYSALSRGISQNAIGISQANQAASLFSGIASVGGRLFQAGGGFSSLFGQRQTSPTTTPVANFTAGFQARPNSPAQAAQTPYYQQSPYGL